MILVESSAFPFLKLLQGKLAVLSTPPDQCIRLEVEHMAPDGSTTTNDFYFHMVNKFEATIEKCSVTHGNCQPNIGDLELKSMAGQSKTVALFEQDSVENYFRACKGALFDLTDAPDWLRLTNSSFLVIEAPNDVHTPGLYHFYLGIWKIALEISAPCSSTFLQGIKE